MVGSVPRVGSKRTTDIYDILGIGVGPSNLALAALIDEAGETVCSRPLRTLFLERGAEFVWHAGMLLDGAHLQVSFLKDLVTLRDPRSKFTFLNYLHTQGRLDHFVNLRTFTPSRQEFNDYYRWVANQVRNQLRFDSLVTALRPQRALGSTDIDFIEVEVRNERTGAEEIYSARNVVVATGGIPAIPNGVDIATLPGVFHSSQFRQSIERDFPDPRCPYRFVVVGAGQSAAEIFHHLIHRYPNADVTATMRQFAYKQADDSFFVNELFSPRMTDVLYHLPQEKRKCIIDSHRDTNYAVVDLELITAIYHELYQQRIRGRERARVMPFLDLRTIVEEEGSLKLHFQELLHEAPRVLSADGVILATGYLRPRLHPLLKSLNPYLLRDGKGYDTGRNYRIRARKGFHPGIFLQGFCEETHGLADTLLSDLSQRSLSILEAIELTDLKCQHCYTDTILRPEVCTHRN